MTGALHVAGARIDVTGVVGGSAEIDMMEAVGYREV